MAKDYQHAESAQTPLGPTAFGLGADGKVYAIPLSTLGTGLLLGSPKSIKTACGTISANTAIIAAVPAKRIKVTVISLRTAYSAAALTPILTDGNGGTTIWNDLEQAISGAISGSVVAKSAPDAICQTTAGNALYLNPGGQSVTYSISYFDDDAS